MRGITLHTREPVYEQVVSHFKIMIANGELKPGDAMPSRRELARMLNINPNTVQRAYKEMEEVRLIHTDGNYPSTITADQVVLRHVREELLQHAVDTFVETVHSLQVPKEEVFARMEDRFIEGERGGMK